MAVVYSLHRDRLKTLWSIMPRVVDEGTHRVGSQLFTRIGTKQCLERIYMLEGWVEPLVVRHGSENHRHPVMNWPHQFIRFRGDDRTGFEWLPFSRFPVFPQPREGERPFTPQSNPQGLLRAPLHLPFIESRRDDEAAAFFEGGSKGRFLCDRFRFGIDALKSYLGVFGPRWDQAPTKHNERPCCSVGIDPYGDDGLRRSDVVAGCEQRRIGEFKLLGNRLRRGGLAKTSTHAVSTSKARPSVGRCQAVVRSRGAVQRLDQRPSIRRPRL